MKKFLLSAATAALVASSANAGIYTNYTNGGIYDFSNLESFKFEFWERGGNTYFTGTHTETSSHLYSTTKSYKESWTEDNGVFLLQWGNHDRISAEGANAGSSILNFGQAIGNAYCLNENGTGFTGYFGDEAVAETTNAFTGWYNFRAFFNNLDASKPARLKIVYSIYRKDQSANPFNGNAIQLRDGEGNAISFSGGAISASSIENSKFYEYTADLTASQTKSTIEFQFALANCNKAVIIKSVELTTIETAEYTDGKTYAFPIQSEEISSIEFSDGILSAVSNDEATTYNAKLYYAVGYTSEAQNGSDAGLTYKAVEGSSVWTNQDGNYALNYNSSELQQAVAADDDDETTTTTNPTIFIKKVGGINNDITLGAYSMTVSTSSNGVVTGVNDIAVSADTEAVYYNLNGVRIANPTVAGVYVRVQNGKASKVVVK